jgi:hypothetical protein
MTGGDFLLWVIGALFAAVLMVVTVTRYVRPIFSERLPAAEEAVLPTGLSTAWLFCEEGAPLDRRAEWFRVRPGGTTVLGNTPLSATHDTTFIYLTAHDIRDRQVTIRWEPGRRGYLLHKGEGSVRHNNEPVPDGAIQTLTDGDTIELGEVTRLRFTFTGPPK